MSNLESVNTKTVELGLNLAKTEFFPLFTVFPCFLFHSQTVYLKTANNEGRIYLL